MTLLLMLGKRAGYVGIHTCKALTGIGCLPVSLDNLVYGHPWAVQWGTFNKPSPPQAAGNYQVKTHCRKKVCRDTPFLVYELKMIR